MTAVLESLLGSGSRAGILAFLAAYKRGYATEIARFLDLDLFAVQKQLQKFEAAGLLRSRREGRNRVYTFDLDHPLQRELTGLIEKAISLQVKIDSTVTSTVLPESLRAFFWDHRFDTLTWEADRELIIRRLLTHGSWSGIVWLRRKIGDGGLRKWLIVHRGRGLSPRQLRFWSLVLGLPRRQVSSWIQTGQAFPWSVR